MRDIVSKHGTIRGAGPTANTTFAANANCNGNANGRAICTANYNGVMFYILPGTWTDGSTNWTIYESNDSTSTAVASVGNFVAVANSDLILWKATNATDYTPVKVGGYQPSAYPCNSAANAVNMRVGYIGSSNANTGCANWVMIGMVITGGTSGFTGTVVCELGEPRFMPAPV